MIKWSRDKGTLELITKISRRAGAMASNYGFKYDQQSAIMDIDAVHENGNPLRLEELLHADDFNFAHDIFDIMDNLNRETGQLENCFVPRYSR